MRLALSSAAAPELSADDLFAACFRRGIAAVELVEGDGHGVGPEAGPDDVANVVSLAAALGVRIAAFRASAATALSPAGARLAGRLDAPLVVPSAGLTRREVAEALPLYAGAGARLLLAHGSDPAEVARLGPFFNDAFELCGLAWDVAPSKGAAFDPRAVLAAGAGRIAHIRLLGGGPEAAAQEGTGIGPLAVALALDAYPGVVALAPSTPRFLTAWRFWLGRRGSGCGSARPALSVVQGGAA